MRLLPALLVLVVASSCVAFDTSCKVVLATDPPGARVTLDGRDAGFVTPCVLEFDPEKAVAVTLQVPGYEPAHRHLVPTEQTYVLLWREMLVRTGVWKGNMWLNMRDFFVPIKYDKALSPARIFVRLERTADQ